MPRTNPNLTPKARLSDDDEDENPRPRKLRKLHHADVFPRSSEGRRSRFEVHREGGAPKKGDIPPSTRARPSPGLFTFCGPLQRAGSTTTVGERYRCGNRARESSDTDSFGSVAVAGLSRTISQLSLRGQVPRGSSQPDTASLRSRMEKLAVDCNDEGSISGEKTRGRVAVSPAASSRVPLRRRQRRDSVSVHRSDDDDEDGDVWYDAEEASTPRSRADSSSQGRIDGSSNDEAPRATVDLASTALSKLSINSSPSLADLASTALSKLRINNPPPVLTLTPATPPPPGTTTTTTTASYPRRHRVDTTRLSVRESDRRLRGPNERHLAAAHDRRAVVARRRERLREALLRHGVRLPEVTGRVYVYTLGWDDWAWYGNW